jgi:hypothetical protein
MNYDSNSNNIVILKALNYVTPNQEERVSCAKGQSYKISVAFEYKKNLLEWMSRFF